MGTFHQTIEIGDPTGQRFEPIDMLVDTGASYTAVPASILTRLGVQPHDRRPFLTATGAIVQRDVGRTWLRIEGRAEITLVIFGDEVAGAVLGALALETFALGVDSTNRRLIPTPALLMRMEPTEMPGRRTHGGRTQ